MPHTPGPWTSNNRAGDIAELEYIAAGERRICMVAGYGHRKGKYSRSKEVEILNLEDEANARLIAAAPELLAALKAIMKDPPAWTTAAQCDAYDKALAAIAKATGTEAFHEDRP